MQPSLYGLEFSMGNGTEAMSLPETLSLVPR